MLPVAGWCPMGCGQTLYLGEGGSVTCASNCPRPSAVTEILSDPETQHIIVADEDGWQGLHPLRERLDGDLLSCDLAGALVTMPPPPGRYRVTRQVRGGMVTWRWDACPESR
jgi:Family of unknown function (DUF6085)